MMLYIFDDMTLSGFCYFFIDLRLLVLLLRLIVLRFFVTFFDLDFRFLLVLLFDFVLLLRFIIFRFLVLFFDLLLLCLDL